MLYKIVSVNVKILFSILFSKLAVIVKIKMGYVAKNEIHKEFGMQDLH